MLFRLLLIAGALCSQQAIAFNKCTLPDGRVAYQDTPCASNAQTEVMRKPKPAVVAKPGAPAVEPNFAIKVPEQAAALMAYYRRWHDGESLLTSTARIALAGPMESAQKLQRELDAYVPPACLDSAAAALRELVALNNKAMLGFMAKQEAPHLIYSVLERPEKIKAFEQRVQSASCD